EVLELDPRSVHPEPRVPARHPAHRQHEVVDLRAAEAVLAGSEQPEALALLDAAAQAVGDGRRRRTAPERGHLPIVTQAERRPLAAAEPAAQAARRALFQ